MRQVAHPNDALQLWKRGGQGQCLSLKCNNERSDNGTTTNGRSPRLLRIMKKWQIRTT
jgi:hypothetical protein